MRQQRSRLPIRWVQRSRCGGKLLSLCNICAVAFNGRKRKQAITMARMALQICAEYRHGLLRSPLLIERYALNIGIARFLWPSRARLSERAKLITHPPFLGVC